MKDIKNRIKKYLVERKWDDLKPADIAKSISIESGELLEIFQWENKTLKEIKRDIKTVEKIKKELADVFIFIYAFDMAVLLDVDPKKIIFKKLDYIDKKYPAELMRNRENKTSGDSDAYWEIKREYRKKHE